MRSFIKWRLSPALFKNLFLDLEDRLGAEALKAHKMVRDYAGLDPKRSRELEGQARFRMEKGFQEVCEQHGGVLLPAGVIPFTDLKVFQPFMRFESHGKGFIFGLAAMSEPRTLPPKNKSRKAGVTLNYHLSPRLDLDGEGPKIGDVFVMFLVSRDRNQAGKIEEFAIGVIDSGYEQFLFYEPLDKYLEGHADAPAIVPSSPASLATTALALRLKTTITPFVPPERPTDDGQDKDSQK